MWSLIGHHAALRLLQQSLEKGRLAHSYLITGPRHVGKMALALQVAQAVNCTSPDGPCQSCPQCTRIATGRHADVQVIAIGEEGGTTRDIGIDQVRDLQHAASLKPFEGSCRVFVVDGAERLSLEATNALLKTLEEPPPQVLLLLLSTDQEALLPTLRSRCQPLELHPVSPREISRSLEERGVPSTEAEELATRCQGLPGIALRAAQEPAWLDHQEQELQRLMETLEQPPHRRLDQAAELARRFTADREEVQGLLRLWLEWWRDLLLVRGQAASFLVHRPLRHRTQALASQVDTQTAAGTCRLVQETMDLLDQNANPRLAMEHLLLGLPHPHPDGER